MAATLTGTVALLPAALGPTRVGGLPTHVLLVHLAVVLVPAAALATVLAALWPAARRRLGAATPLLALAALAVVPLTTSAGEWLARRLPSTPGLERHVRLGDGLLPWVAGLAVVAVLDHGRSRREPVTAGTPTPPRVPAPGAGSTALLQRSAPARVTAGARPRTAGAVAAGLAALAVVTAAGAVVQVYRIGDSGARAVWEGTLDGAAGTGGAGSG